LLPPPKDTGGNEEPDGKYQPEDSVRVYQHHDNSRQGQSTQKHCFISYFDTNLPIYEILFFPIDYHHPIHTCYNQPVRIFETIVKHAYFLGQIKAFNRMHRRGSHPGETGAILQMTSNSSELHIIRVSKSFQTGRRARIEVLREASLWLRRGEVVSVLGPTGCGKSTLLRLIAGLDQPDSGSITFDAEVVDHLSPYQRGIGLVFQNYALYPHFKVHGNIAFYFRLRRWTPDAVDDKVLETAAIMGMGFEALLGRMPRNLSGGEKQRVALARCISHNPRVLLLDEPFSNLDASLRLKTRTEVKRLVEQFGLTTVFVTHDQSEAVAMGHRLAIMHAGEIIQVGTFQELYQQPLNQFVAGFLGSPPMHFFTGWRQGADLVVDVGQTRLRAPLPAHLQHRLDPDSRLQVGLRPEHFYLAEPETPWSLPCDIEAVEMLVSDAAQLVYVRHGSTKFCAKLNLQNTFRPHGTLWLGIPPEQLHVFDTNGKRL
jgi:ABC-type sugar transport system ATPase subunit